VKVQQCYLDKRLILKYRIFSDSNAELLTDLSTISSFVGLVISLFGLGVSIFLIIEAKKISRLFLGKARVPELVKDLKNAYQEISDIMPNFEKNKNEIFTKFLESKSLVENLEKKLTDDLEKKKCKTYKSMFFKDKYFILKHRKVEFTAAESWVLLRELSALITSITEFEKDLKWN
tara:strand:- start:2097 stop:2624 length:528 start_codon:yes stop_codon:yes gene_type:complete